MKEYQFREGIALIENDFYRKFKSKMIKTMKKSSREFFDQVQLYVKDLDAFQSQTYNEGTNISYNEIISELIQVISSDVVGEYKIALDIILEHGKISFKNVKFQISDNETVSTDWEFFHSEILSVLGQDPDLIFYSYSGVIIFEYSSSTNYLLSNQSLIHGDGLLIELAIQTLGSDLPKLENKDFFEVFENFLYNISICVELKLISFIKLNLLKRYQEYLIEEFS